MDLTKEIKIKENILKKVNLSDADNKTAIFLAMDIYYEDRNRKLNTLDIYSFLQKCDFEQIRLIEILISFASDIVEYQLEFKLSDEQLADEFKVDVNTLTKMKKGGYEFKLSDISHLRNLINKRKAQEYANENTKVKVNI